MFQGEGIKCYDCNSHNDTRCAQEVPPEIFKKDCSEHIEGSKYTLCRKIVQSIEHEVNGLQPDSRIIRNCGWDTSNYVGRCYQRSGFGGRQEVCTCTTDLCNAANLNGPATAATIAAFSIAALVAFRL
ncbi:hypothetical protein AAG570_002334 [Ranatra chinensis]|uniref:Protein sleepless n=1 Tax=Ranatra chinensis TaxID=642074 RepID=A0ABD0YTY0_9HEMI